MSPPIPDALFTIEVRDSETGPWRPMCSDGADGTEESMIHAFAVRDVADEMPRTAMGTLAFHDARVVRWGRVTGDG
jgi:hypothetical protein